MSPNAAIDALLKKAVADGDVAGVIATAGTASEVAYEGAAGLRSIDGDSPMTADTVTFYASCTKALTGAAVMQLVERGRLTLDSPAAKVLPELDKLQVLEGFDEAGHPILRRPRSPITLRQLLTHTAGFTYEFWNADAGRWLEYKGLPNALSGARATFERALQHDPGSVWDYGPSIDYAGRLLEEVSGERLGDYARKHLFEPLGMHNTSFRITRAQRPHLASMHARGENGVIVPFPFELDQNAEVDMGGHGVYGTAPDYLRFLRMIINGGVLDGVRVLERGTVEQMSQNQIGSLHVRPLKSVMPMFTNDCEFYPGMPCQWGLSFLINNEQTAEGRSAGSLSWAGICNSYYWADPHRKVAGVLMTQLIPFFDERTLNVFRQFERAVYSPYT